MITIKLPMKIIPKKRPYVTNKGTFMPKAYLDQRKMLRLKFRPFKKLEGELFMDCLFVFNKAKSISKNKYSMPVPDVDNLIGSIMDAGQGILYDDDRQIVEIRSKKIWGDQNIVFIELKEVCYNT